MDENIIYDVPFVSSVFFPTDFSPASERAFAHALAIAMIRQTRFTLLHVGSSKTEWTEFSLVVQVLERWGVLKPGNSRREVFEQLALRMHTIALNEQEPLPAILDFLRQSPTDLIVLSTGGRTGLTRWLQPSKAERVRKKSNTMTLFVPSHAHGFVNAQTGQFLLTRILIPVDAELNPRPALEYAARIAKVVGIPVEVELLYVGDAAKPLDLDLPPQPMLNWHKVTRQGNAAQEIVERASQQQSNLIIMSTRGHHGILDALRGSVTEQVLRKARCPVLAIPL
jgi:nucleotide-binding universal stress UspA family protein